jgi:vacuolar-type H+-ATPase subunit I/STV1
MVSGVLRDKNSTFRQWINPALMLLIPLVLMFLPMHYARQGGIWLRAEDMTFATIHAKLAGDLHHVLVLNSDLLNDAVVAGLLRIFAFVYLFHYLNWFTKIELLEWHKVSRLNWLCIVLVYVFCLVLYRWNVRIGFEVAAFLGLLHVLLEFPLNWHTLNFVARVRPRHVSRSSVRQELSDF